MIRKRSSAVIVFALVLLSSGICSIYAWAFDPDEWDRRGEVLAKANQVELDDARRVAIEALMKFGNIPEGELTIYGVTGDRLRDAVLGDPFFYYWSGYEFEGYEFAEPTALLEFMRGFAVEFPVIVDEEVVGLISVAPNRETGQLQFLSGAYDTELPDRVMNIRKRYPGSSVSFVNTGIAGHYFLLEGHEGQWQLSPANQYAAYIMGLGPEDNHELDFHPLTRVSNEIKKTLEESR